jgi:hypothetical protein
VEDLEHALNPELPTLIICDTEGYEDILLRPEVVPSLRKAWMLIETHDFIVSGVFKKIIERFSATHATVTINSAPRSLSDSPRMAPFAKLIPRSILLTAVSEGRHPGQPWLWLMPVSR